MTKYIVLLFAAAIPFSLASSDTFSTAGEGRATGERAGLMVLADEGDPGQTLYKEAYNLVLAGKWPQARETFAQLLKLYPKSSYADDARYWSAYAEMHLDRKKALVEYKEFINRHPRSTYLDDAVADLGNLESEIATENVRTQLEQEMKTRFRSDSVRVRIPSPAGFASPSPFPHMDMRGFNLGMKRFGWQMKRWLGPQTVAENVDKATQLRIEALAALGQGNEDDHGFQTLKSVALDRSQPVPLRIEAMNQLSDFKKHDPAPVFVELAQSDTNEEIQSASLDYLRQSVSDDNKSVLIFRGLFEKVPSSRADQRSMILY
ncbi:MAG: tetratricopeptide repeat protein, partial [Bacteroidota bacterium]